MDTISIEFILHSLCCEEDWIEINLGEESSNVDTNIFKMLFKPCYFSDLWPL
jgi:hypothetical protein